MRAAEAARRAVELSAAQYQRLEAGDFDGYGKHEAAQEAACRVVLEWPVAEFDAETIALVDELSGLQRRLCEQFDALLERAGADNRRLRAGQRAMHAYGAPGTATPLRTRTG
ncbi:MAG: hypothetical protein R3C29_16740 [Dehalococcoidia bacterium]